MSPGDRRSRLLKTAILIFALWLPVTGTLVVASAPYGECPVLAVHTGTGDSAPGTSCSASAHCAAALTSIATAKGTAAPEQPGRTAVVPLVSAPVLPADRPLLALA